VAAGVAALSVLVNVILVAVLATHK
jgi:hypothetical protein